MGESINTPEIQATRDDARALIEARGISMAEASRQSGVANSTLSAWMGGTYTGNNQRVADLVRTWLRHAVEQAQHRVALPVLPPFISTPTASSIMELLGFAQAAPDIVLITGTAGIGKTTTLQEYQRTHPNVWMHTAEPASSSVHCLLEGICEAIGIREHSINKRSRSIVARVRGSQGLLIVDEAQHLSSTALDQLRSTIHDAAQIGIAVAGNSEVFARIDGDNRRGLFAQFRSRVGMRISRNKPLAGDVEALLDAAGIAGTAERKLLRVIAGKPGALRGMAKTLRVAHILAAGDGGTITEAHLRAAAARLSDDGVAETA